LKKTASNKKTLYLALFATLAMILYAQFVLGHYSSCFHIEDATNSLGLTFGYSSEDVMAFLEQRDSSQLLCYQEFLKIWDGIFPVLYTFMYVLWIKYFFTKWRYLALIPILHMIIDWSENAIEIILVDQYLTSGSIIDDWVFLGSTVTISKWALSFLTYGIILYGIIIKLRQQFKSESD